MRLLPDINIWIALSIPHHSNHRRAAVWFAGLSNHDILYFCRVTQHGFLRLATTASMAGAETVSNREAWKGYFKFRADPRIQWLDEPEGLEELWADYSSSELPSPRRWTDAYLAAFCKLQELRLVTLDRGFRNYRGLDWIEPAAPK